MFKSCYSMKNTDEHDLFLCEIDVLYDSACIEQVLEASAYNTLGEYPA